MCVPVELVSIEERLLSGQVGRGGGDPEQLLAQAPCQHVQGSNTLNSQQEDENETTEERYETKPTTKKGKRTNFARNVHINMNDEKLHKHW